MFSNASDWSAERVRDEYPEFTINTEKPIYFTGEMIYSWMFDDYSELRKVQDVANRVAADPDWPALFDEEQLAKNKVPVYAAVYQEDVSRLLTTIQDPTDFGLDVCRLRLLPRDGRKDQRQQDIHDQCHVP